MKPDNTLKYNKSGRQEILDFLLPGFGNVLGEVCKSFHKCTDINHKHQNIQQMHKLLVYLIMNL